MFSMFSQFSQAEIPWDTWSPLKIGLAPKVVSKPSWTSGADCKTSGVWWRIPINDSKKRAESCTKRGILTLPVVLIPECKRPWWWHTHPTTSQQQQQQFQKKTCMVWVFPLPSNSHHQDFQIFSTGSQPKPSFASITGKGDNPKYVVISKACPSTTSFISWETLVSLGNAHMLLLHSSLWLSGAFSQ